MRIEKGNYKGKHPSEAIPDFVISEAAKKVIADGTITCSAAEDIAHALLKSMAEVGAVLDLMETRIIKCQLGLFGYYPQQKIVAPAQEVDPKVEEAIKANLINGRLPCHAAWELAKAFALPRIAISSICEAKGIRIRPCQLGAF